MDTNESNGVKIKEVLWGQRSNQLNYVPSLCSSGERETLDSTVFAFSQRLRLLQRFQQNIANFLGEMDSKWTASQIAQNRLHTSYKQRSLYKL